MNFEHTPEFQKDLKKLAKKWRSLASDLEAVKLQIVDLYKGQGHQDKTSEYRAAFFNGRRATILRSLKDGREVVKMRLDVEALGTNNKVRLVFIAIRQQDSVLFVELFAKNEQLREDARRIERYI